MPCSQRLNLQGLSGVIAYSAESDFVYVNETRTDSIGSQAYQVGPDELAMKKR